MPLGSTLALALALVVVAGHCQTVELLLPSCPDLGTADSARCSCVPLAWQGGHLTLVPAHRTDPSDGGAGITRLVVRARMRGLMERSLWLWARGAPHGDRLS